MARTGRIVPEVGAVFGRWRVVGAISGRALPCVCECGKEKIVALGSLLRGVSTSCGCLRAEQVAAKNYKHGGRQSREYAAWSHMHARCSDPRDGRYPQYGGRGIKVCERWSGENGAANFLADMGARPSPQHSLDRIDVNGNYEPANCRWASPEQQGNNTRRNVFVEWKGQRLTVSQLARDQGVNRRRLAKMLSNGLGIDEAMARVAHDTRLNYELKWKSP